MLHCVRIVLHSDTLEQLYSNEYSYCIYFIERLKYIASIQLRHDINDWIVSLQNKDRYE